VATKLFSAARLDCGGLRLAWREATAQRHRRRPSAVAARGRAGLRLLPDGPPAPVAHDAARARRQPPGVRSRGGARAGLRPGLGRSRHRAGLT
jgi:hypothetical protein